jgi:putative addiction module component (TIGR02574 family)
VDERLALIEALWNSIVDQHGDELPVTPAQRAILDRRLAAHEAAPDESLPWDEVRARLLDRSTIR